MKKALLLSLLLPCCAYPMGGAAQWKSRISNVAYWALAAGPVWYDLAKEAKVRLKHSLLGEYVGDPAPEVVDFVRKIAESKGVNKDLEVKYAIGVDYAAHNMPDRIYLPVEWTQERVKVSQGSYRQISCLEARLKKCATDAPDKAAVDAELDQDRFAIAHECGHVINNDSTKVILWSAVLPLPSHTAYRMLCKVPRGSLAHIAAGAALGMANWLTLRNITRSYEKRADLLETDPKIIRGGISFLQRAKDKLQQAIHKTFDEQWQRDLYAQYIEFIDVHPPLDERIAYLEEHIKEIEKIQSAKA